MSDDDWEAAAESAADEVPVVSRWEGEDEEEPVAESWDQDPEEEKKRKAAAAAANASKAAQGPVVSQRKKKVLEEEEKKRKEKEAAEAETDPSLRAARKAEETARALKRDATLAASLLGVELSDDTDQQPTAAITERDAGNDIAAGGEKVSAEELARVGRGGGSLDDFQFDNDASIDKLATLLAKRATDLPSNAKNSARLLRFLKSLTDTICNPMKLDDVAELRRSITAKHNELTIKQKQQQKGKKAATAALPGSKKANTVKVSSGGGGASAGRNTGMYGDELADDYGGEDEDFM